MAAARNEGGLIEAKAMMGMAKVLQAKEEMTAARSLGKICIFLFLLELQCLFCSVEDEMYARVTPPFFVEGKDLGALNMKLFQGV